MSDTIESTAKTEPEASSSSAVLTGIKRGFPIFLGYVPLGFAYGVLAVQNNIPAVYAVLFSLFVYAGAGAVHRRRPMGDGRIRLFHRLHHVRASTCGMCSCPPP